MRRILILQIILPIFVIMFTALFFYSRHELNTTLHETELNLTQYISNKAEEFGNLLDSMASEMSGTTTLLSLPQTDCREYLFDLISSRPKIHGISVAYDPAFLKEVREGNYPDYQLQSASLIDDSRQAPEKLNYMIWRDIEGNIHEQNSGRFEYLAYDWYVMAKKFRRAFWAEPENSILDDRHFVAPYAAPFFYQGKFAGVFCVAFDVKQSFSDTFNFSFYLKDIKGHFILLSSDGDALFHSSPVVMPYSNVYSAVRENRVKDLYPLVDRVLSGAVGSACFENWGEGLRLYDKPQNVRFLFAPILIDPDLFVVVSFREREIYAALYHRLALLWLHAGLLMFLVVGVTTFVVMRIYNPVHKMAVISEKITHGDFDVHVPDRYLRRKSVIGMLANNFSSMISNLNENIQNATRERTRRVMLESQLSVAQQIQGTLRPRKSSLHGWELFDLEAMIIPAQYVAGDFYDYWQIDDHRIAILLGDVSGKGIPASLVMVAIRTLIRQISSKLKTPSEIVTEVNRNIQIANDKMMFTTMYYAEYDFVTGKLIYCNTGHNPPALVGADGAVRWQNKSDNTVLGIFADMRFHSEETLLAPGETLFLFTDGVTESRLQNGEIYGEARLEVLLGKVACEPLPDMLDYIKDVLITYSGSEQPDDITMLALRRKMDPKNENHPSPNAG